MHLSPRCGSVVVNSLVVAASIVWQLVFYLIFVIWLYYYAVFGLVIILCMCEVGCLTLDNLVVASVFVVLLFRDLTTPESRVKVWRL